MHCVWILDIRWLKSKVIIILLLMLNNTNRYALNTQDLIL